MKTLIKLVALTAIAIACISCNKVNTPPEEVEYVYAKVDFSGDISIQPLKTKSSGSVESFESGDLLILTINRYTDDSFNGFQSLAAYQSGAFTDASNIVIPLIKGGHYQIIAFVLKGVASSAKWAEFSKYNQLLDNIYIPMFSMNIGREFIGHYKSFRGGQRLTANSDVDLNLKMVKNYFGVTLNYDDVKGEVLVCSAATGPGSPDISSYATAASEKTLLINFSENTNTGTGDNGRCNTYEEQCITTGDNAIYDPEYLRGFDIRIARRLDGKVSHLNVITVEVKAGDNVIINIEESDFTGYTGELSLDFSEDTGMNDVHYN